MLCGGCSQIMSRVSSAVMRSGRSRPGAHRVAQVVQQRCGLDTQPQARPDAMIRERAAAAVLSRNTEASRESASVCHSAPGPRRPDTPPGAGGEGAPSPHHPALVVRAAGSAAVRLRRPGAECARRISARHALPWPRGGDRHRLHRLHPAGRVRRCQGTAGASAPAHGRLRRCGHRCHGGAGGLRRSRAVGSRRHLGGRLRQHDLRLLRPDRAHERRPGGPEIGANAARLLLERITDRNKASVQVTLSPTLIPRRSTAPPAR